MSRLDYDMYYLPKEIINELEHEDMPTDISKDQQIEWLASKLNSTIYEFNRLCRIVNDLQKELEHFIRLTEFSDNCIMQKIEDHTKGFHSRAIFIGMDKDEKSDDENNIS